MGDIVSLLPSVFMLSINHLRFPGGHCSYHRQTCTLYVVAIGHSDVQCITLVKLHEETGQTGWWMDEKIIWHICITIHWYVSITSYWISDGSDVKHFWYLYCSKYRVEHNKLCNKESAIWWHKSIQYMCIEVFDTRTGIFTTLFRISSIWYRTWWSLG